MELSSNQVKSNRITNHSGHHFIVHCFVSLSHTRNQYWLQKERLGLGFRETVCAHSLIHVFIQQIFHCVSIWVLQYGIDKTGVVPVPPSF